MPMKVRCIDNTNAEDLLELGKVYTVNGPGTTLIGGPTYLLEEIPTSRAPGGWWQHRFEAVPESEVFEQGDVVVLKGLGVPRMTIEYLEGASGQKHAVCVWLDIWSRLQRERIQLGALEKVALP